VAIVAGALAALGPNVAAADPPAAAPVAAPPATTAPIAAPTTPAAAPTTTPAATPAADAGPRMVIPPEAAAIEARIVEVHLDTPRRVRLDRRKDESSPWVEVCWSPCDTRTWADATYRVVGEDVVPSETFTLPPAKDGKVSLDVKPASRNKRNAGWVTLGGGVALTVAGAIVAGAASKATDTFSNDGQTHNSHYDAVAAGTIMMIAGVAAGLTGGAWAYEGTQTRVGASDAQAPAPPSSGSARPAQPGFAFALPLLSGRF
jgi:hypothetical protein